MALEHSFINGKHFFHAYENQNGNKLSQDIEVMVKLNCDCQSGSIWGVGGVCYHLETCLKYLLMKPKERLKVRFGDVNLIKKNAVLGLVRNSNLKLNVLRDSDGESELHRSLKYKICSALELLNIDFVCEAIIEHKRFKQRCDILIPELALVVEIAVSEKDESLDEKRKVFEKLGLKMKVVK